MQSSVLETARAFLNLALKSAALARMAGTLAETYLGRDPARRVMSGRIARGVAEKIGAVLWYSDLHGYTHISDSAAPEQIIPLLNDYADVVVSAVHESWRRRAEAGRRRNVGYLSPARIASSACLAALAAAAQVRNARRQA